MESSVFEIPLAKDTVRAYLVVRVKNPVIIPEMLSQSSLQSTYTNNELTSLELQRK